MIVPLAALQGTFAASSVPHTRLIDKTAIVVHRRTLNFLNVYVKTIPAGNILHLRLESNDTVAYMFFQFRHQSGELGFDDAVVSVHRAPLPWRCRDVTELWCANTVYVVSYGERPCRRVL